MSNRHPAAMIAYCGLICTDCPAYIATKANDLEALQRVAKQWQEEFNAPDITAESVICDGCVDAEGRHCSHWPECDVRACGWEHGVANCGHCADYPCDKMERFFGFAPDARTVLDAIHQSLMA